jgi:hypothetical protein
MQDQLDHPDKQKPPLVERGDPYRLVNPDLDIHTVLSFAQEVEQESANQAKRLGLWYSFFTWMTWTLTALTWLSLFLGRLYKVKGLASDGI